MWVLGYRKNGYLALTDANVQLGRVHPDYFPKIFGETEDQPLDVAAVEKAFSDLTKEVNSVLNKQKTADEVAAGFLDVLRIFY